MVFNVGEYEVEGKTLHKPKVILMTLKVGKVRIDLTNIIRR